MNIVIDGVTHAPDPVYGTNEAIAQSPYQRTACGTWGFIGKRGSKIAASGRLAEHQVDCMACIAIGYELCLGT